MNSPSFVTDILNASTPTTSDSRFSARSMSSLSSSHSAASQPAVVQSPVAPSFVGLPFFARSVAAQLPDVQPVVVQPVVQHGMPHSIPDASIISRGLVPQQSQFRPGRKRPVDVFLDREARSMPQGRPAQRPRLDGRVPLAKRSASANSTPTPSPRDDAASFSESSNDPVWTGKENQDPSPPNTPEPFIAAFPYNPAAPIGPPPPPSPRARISRPVRSARLPLPQNMVLYEILGLDDWKVSRNQILSVWRHASLGLHPDRVAKEDRHVATILTQQINAAKEVLTDPAARRRYHQTGAIPTAI